MLRVVSEGNPDRQRRIKSVLAALQAQRKHLAELDTDEEADIGY